jgi:hypothetical protein
MIDHYFDRVVEDLSELLDPMELNQLVVLLEKSEHSLE